MSVATLTLESSYTTRPGTGTSSRTKVIRDEDEEKQEELEKLDALESALKSGPQVKQLPVLTGGEGESAIPEDKKVGAPPPVTLFPILFRRSSTSQEESLENAEDDWTHDPRNPRNWRVRTKWVMVGVVSPTSSSTTLTHKFCYWIQVSLYTLIPPLASSMMAPALPDIGTHFGITDPTLIALTLSVFLITFAIGPLFLAPLSEIYGRTWVCQYS